MINVSSMKLFLFVILVYIACSNSHQIKKCFKQPDTWKKVEKAVKECQEHVKLNIIKDAFQSVNDDEWIDSIFDHDDYKHLTTISPFITHHSSITDHYTNDPVYDYLALHQNNHPSVHGHESLVHHHQPSTHDLSHSLINDHHLSNPHHTDTHSSIHEYPLPHHDHLHEYPLPHHDHLHEKHFNENHVACHNKQAHLKPPHHSLTSGHHNHNAPSTVHHTSEHQTHTDTFSDAPIEHHQHIDFTDFRKKRETSDHHYIHPSIVTYHDKRIAGCIMQCIFEKNHAVDKLGWPTLDGLVNFYTEGVNEHGYFMATLRAVDHCLKASSVKYHVNRRSTPENGQTCDVAFDVFDCISDRITEYCSEHEHEQYYY